MKFKSLVAEEATGEDVRGRWTVAEVKDATWLFTYFCWRRRLCKLKHNSYCGLTEIYGVLGKIIKLVLADGELGRGR